MWRNGRESEAHRNREIYAGGVGIGVACIDDNYRSVVWADYLADFERENRVGDNGVWGNGDSVCGFLRRSGCGMQDDHASKAACVYYFGRNISFFADSNRGADVRRPA